MPSTDTARFVRLAGQTARFAWRTGRSAIFPGVTIGEGSTIGAAIVVTRSIPVGVVAVGNPRACNYSFTLK